MVRCRVCVRTVDRIGSLHGHALGFICNSSTTATSRRILVFLLVIINILLLLIVFFICLILNFIFVCARNNSDYFVVALCTTMWCAFHECIPRVIFIGVFNNNSSFLICITFIPCAYNSKHTLQPKETRTNFCEASATYARNTQHTI
jgi:hypothetical protein